MTCQVEETAMKTRRERVSPVGAPKIEIVGILCLLLTLAGTPVLGQTQTGSIVGVVVSSDGKVLQDATVSLSGPSMMGTKVNSTGSSGAFRFRALLPGDDYVVSVMRDGFQGARYEAVVVEIGKATSLRLSLEVAAVSDSVSVTSSARPVVEITSTATSTHFNSELLESVPARDRSWEDLVLLAPGVVDGSVAGRGRMFSSRGGSVVDNQSAFDGVISTSPQTNTEGTGIAFEAIEEVQVLSGALPAEIGNVAGQYVNLVTKVGGNSFSGNFAVYFEDDGLQSDNVTNDLAEAGIEPTVLTGFEDWSFNLGGPIAKDKMWFFASASGRESSVDVSGFPEDETFENDLRFVKLSWQPTLQQGLVFVHDAQDTSLNHFATVPLSQHTPEATRRRLRDNRISKLKWTALVSEVGLFEADLATSRQTTEVLAQEGSGPANFDLVTGLLSGGAFQENTFNDGRDLARLSYSHFLEGGSGTHQLKFGAEYEDSKTDIFSSNERSPVLAHLLFAGAPGLVLFSNSAAGVYTRASIEGLHAYAQDTWQLSDRVTLNLGLRFNTWKGFFPPQSSPAFEYGSNVSIPAITLDREIEALSWESWEPRLAVAMALDGDHQSVLRFGIGRYHHGIATSFFNLANPVGFSSSTHGWADFDGDLFADPNEVSPALATTFASPGAIHPDLEQAHTDEVNATFETRLPHEISFAINAFYRESRDLVEDTNISAGDGSYVPVVIPDPGVDSALGTADDSSLTVFNQVADFDNVLQLTNPSFAEREARGVELVANKRFSNRWQALASIVWQEATGTVGNNILNSLGNSVAFNDPNARVNLDGALELDREWQAKVLGSYEGPFGFIFTGYFQFLTGVPIYREVTVSLNQGAVVVVADPKGSHREEDLTQFDLRVEKSIPLGSGPLELSLALDILNVFNESAVTRSSPSGGTYDVASGTYFAPAGGFAAPQEVQPPRIVRIGARLRF